MLFGKTNCKRIDQRLADGLGARKERSVVAMISPKESTPAEMPCMSLRAVFWRRSHDNDENVLPQSCTNKHSSFSCICSSSIVY